MTKETKGSCFVISPIGEDGSDTRKRSDQILKHVISPAVEQCGYESTRADKISEPGMITSQVIQHIVEDPLVVADLTDSNPNVFYELALRHALRKPLVQLINKGEKIPFDVAGMRTISVDHHDLDSVEESREEIVKQVKALEGKKPEEIESPISVSLELQMLRQSENPEERTYGELITAISAIRSDIDSIEKRLSDPESILPRRYVSSLLNRKGNASARKTLMNIDELRMRLAHLVHASKSKPDKETQHMFEEMEYLMNRITRELDGCN